MLRSNADCPERSSTLSFKTTLMVIGTVSLLTVGCGSSRISGAYIARGPTFVSMLQLTNVGSGSVTGVFSSVSVNSDGRINSEQQSITGGAVDGDQITLSVQSFLFGTNVAGTIRGSRIEFQTLESNGHVQQWLYKRGSQSDFREYTEELRHDADAIVLSKNLGRRSQELRQAVQSAEKWVSYAELHAQKIPGVKDYYRKVEEQMRSTVERERATSNSVARTQMSVNVIQSNVTANQADLQVNQMWDRTIADSGQALSRTFASLPPNCDPTKLKKYGAAPQAIATWQSACQQAQAERTRFEPAFKRIMEQRADLKSFQVAAESRRQALVDEAGRVQ